MTDERTPISGDFMGSVRNDFVADRLSAERTKFGEKFEPYTRFVTGFVRWMDEPVREEDEKQLKNLLDQAQASGFGQDELITMQAKAKAIHKDWRDELGSPITIKETNISQVSRTQPQSNIK